MQYGHPGGMSLEQEKTETRIIDGVAVKVKTVAVTYGRKVNLGDFNSANVECTLWVEVEGDPAGLNAVMSELWGMAKTNVAKQIYEAKGGAKLEAKAQEMFMGLPMDLQESIAQMEDGYADQGTH